MACAVIFVLAALSLATPALPSSTVILSGADYGAVKKQKKAKPAKPAKPTKPAKAAKTAPKAPEKPKESWELPMKVVIVRSSVPNCEPLCPEWIMAEGEITAATPAAFRKVLKQAGKRKLPVILLSPGGNVDAAIEIGRLIRKNKLNIAVGFTRYEDCGPFGKACKLPISQNGIYRGTAKSWASYCNSACPLILAGGTERIAHYSAQVGVHQIKTIWTREIVRYWETYKIVKGKKKVISRKVVSRKPGKSYATYGIDKRLRKKLTAYLKEMGTSPAMVDDMEKAPYTSLFYLSSHRRKELSLATIEADAGMFGNNMLCQQSVAAPVCVERKDFLPAALAPSAAKSLDIPKAPDSLGITSADKPMTVAIVRNPAQGCEPLCPQWISAQGVITPDTPKRLAEVLAKMGSENVPVAFDSPGGDFDAALEIARMIRARGLHSIIVTTVFIGCSPDADCKPSSPSGFHKGFPMSTARCNGACLFAAIGGVSLRSVNGNVSLHNPALYQSHADTRPAAVQLMLHFAKMGIGKDLLPRLQKMTTGQVLNLDSSQQATFLRAITGDGSNAHLLKPVACKTVGPAWYCVKLKAGS